MRLNEVFTAPEATILWGLADRTIRKACTEQRLPSDHCRKSGRDWLVTKQGMDQAYGTILERIVHGKHNSPIDGLVYLYQLEEIDKIDIQIKLTLPPLIRRQALDRVMELE